jgi:hypothetical protein
MTRTWTRRGAVGLVAALTLGLGALASADPPPASLADRGRLGRVVPPVIDDIEQVCALLTSCDRLPIPASMVPSDFAACVKTLESQLASPGAIAYSLLVRECGLRANSCSELRTCGLRGASPDACTGRGKDAVAGYCDIDGRALRCSHEKVVGVRDCPRGGEQCSVREGQAACSLGPCPKEVPEGAPAVCSASGTRILRCEHGVLNSLDCSAFGLICGAGAGEAACASPTTACTGDARRCEGDVAVSCFAGHEVRVDCAAGGLVCAGAGRSVGACIAPPPQTGGCDPASAPRCDGATLRYCDAGRPRSYLCKALGFNRCINDATGSRCG